MQVHLSIREVPNLTKSEREDIKYYTRFIKCNFTALKYMLSKDYIYSPFGYIGFEQGLHNICSEADFVIIDVDYTSISIYDRLAQLAEENLECILGTTNDTTNLFKCRILIPLDRPVNKHEYRRLVAGIRVNQLIPDMDKSSEKPSQKFYSYANSIILYNKGLPLVVDDYILPEPSAIEPAQLSSSLELHEILHEFQSYTLATKGKRTRSLLSAAFNLVERGADDKLLEQVILHLNNSFLIPKRPEDVYRRVINFIKQRRQFLWY